MSFWRTFFDIWKIRTSIRIQESVENYLVESRLASEKQANLPQIISEVTKKNSSWDENLKNSRNKQYLHFGPSRCEFCETKFHIVSYKNSKPIFVGYTLVNNEAFKCNESNLEAISLKIKEFPPLELRFYCSKKCLIHDTSNSWINGKIIQ